MHMADALVSPQVAGITGLISAGVIFIATRKVRNSDTDNIIPLMGVMGAFIFVSQMINFSVPGTGSSGHIIGGILLSSILGPWAAFITLSSVLIIQCLLFADGGLMAIGCNILNMAVCSCLIAYPFIYKPLMSYPASFTRIMFVSILSCLIGLELGAIFVTIQTELSGITALPFNKFLILMVSIHFLIGISEGIATGFILFFIQKFRPDLFFSSKKETTQSLSRFGKPALFFALLSLIGGLFTWISSSKPDGLEWSILELTGSTEIQTHPSNHVLKFFSEMQKSTALIPDYNSTFAGIIGGIIVVLVVWVITKIVHKNKLLSNKNNE